jgi:hypothetical protein
MTFEESMLEKHGLLMTMKTLAKELDRTEGGLRMYLRSKSKDAQEFNSTKKKVGRRILFRTVEVAKVLSSNDEPHKAG